jgi:signal transduction histidine kinase
MCGTVITFRVGGRKPRTEEMTMRPAAALRLRRGPLWGEIAALVAVAVADLAAQIELATVPKDAPAIVVSVLDAVVAVIAVARRRFPDRLPAVMSAALLVLGVTIAIGVVSGPEPILPGALSTLAMSLLTGACCHQLPARQAGLFTILAGVGVLLGPVLVYGPQVITVIIAVFVGVTWVGGVAVGLILRDAATRNASATALARSTERLALARELHDLVAHHITGVVVRAQAANLVLSDQPERTDEHALLIEIEKTGASALGAMRRLVSVLRDPAAEPLAEPHGTLSAAITAAVGENGAIAVRLAPELADVSAPPEVVSTAHRVVLEALTNVRKHAPAATTIDVAGATQPGGWARITVRNDGVRQGLIARRSGYGLVGMRERVEAVGGRVDVGSWRERGWQVTVLLPVATGEKNGEA